MSSDWPHVTAIIQAAGLIDATWFRDFDLERGSAVHKAAQFLDEGDLDWSTVDPVVLPRLRQYQRFLDETDVEILEIETEVRHQVYRYVGTPDRVVKLAGRLAILDLKGPSRADWHGVQGAAYCACFKQPLARWNLYLGDNEYRLIEQTDRADWETFKAALTLYRWKETHHVG